jgi:hypothetical protein
MLAAVNAQEIEVPCFDLTMQGGDMPNSVPPLHRYVGAKTTYYTGKMFSQEADKVSRKGNIS